MCVSVKINSSKQYCFNDNVVIPSSPFAATSQDLAFAARSSWYIYPSIIQYYWLSLIVCPSNCCIWTKLVWWRVVDLTSPKSYYEIRVSVVIINPVGFCVFYFFEGL
jgi:hypothetical protein